MIANGNSNLIFNNIIITEKESYFDQISNDVKASWNWVGYRIDNRGQKIPVKATNPDVDALVNDDRTWVTFDRAFKALSDDETELDGIGLVIVRDGNNQFQLDDLTSVTLEDLAISRYDRLPKKQDRTEKESLKPIGTDPRLTTRLEDSNFVSRYCDHCSSMNDAYPEYHHAGALALLSFAADRKVIMRLKSGKHYTNIWSLCLGQSTISRKSTALGIVAEFLDEDDKNFQRRLPEQFSPESFIEQMSDHPHSYLINDECGGLFKALNKKQYMADLKDTLCTVYDNRRISRKLRTNKRDKLVQTDFSVKDPYLTILFATTFESLANSIIEDDFTSGLLPRFLPYYPAYPKESRGVAYETEDDDATKNDLKAQFELILTNVSRVNSIQLVLYETGLSLYNQWILEKEKELLQSQDPVVSSVFGRYQVYALKIAMLFTVGSKAFQNYIKGLESGVDVEYLIPDAYVIEAIREIDEYFIPTIVTIREKIANHGADNLQGKIIDLLKRAGGELTRSSLMNGCNLSKMGKDKTHFDRALDTLIEMDMVEKIHEPAQEVSQKRMKNKVYKPVTRYRLNMPSNLSIQ